MITTVNAAGKKKNGSRYAETLLSAVSSEGF